MRRAILTASMTLGPSLAAQPTVTHLPAPTGPYGVGRVEYHWIDSTRTETFDNSPGARREMAVYVWYPARHGGNRPFAEYIPHLAAIRRAIGDSAIRDEFGDALHGILSGDVHAFAVDAAPFEPSAGPSPLLVFSHGFGEASLTYA